ncbi:glycosyltransferase family 2 protein [Paenibacillus sp. M1]|uniref:Glycosyltransferase family 2 protein n=1 Tax=Paenibacillus haidiansis TaxID=1574488 RepID=A0ABU7VW43_9BACL
MTEGNADFRRGYEAGYSRGFTAGKTTFGNRFEGVSIIIPTFNKKEMLRECLDSIEAHTEHPYEVIVVDNGSEDGTAEMLRQRRGNLRFTVHPRNLGFARAVNTGLMMAKGNYLLLLNNDVLVTERWLSQMLACLKECPGAAAVGPVTNYIGGEQQIQVPYADIRGMREFAAAYNRKDPSKWWDTDRLVGFCLLFSRKTFEETGYLDEGYEIGNFEDDDWMVRLRFQGKRLKIAGDTFVHHYGSVTMKGLGPQGFFETNSRNENFFTDKWGSPHEALQRMKSQFRASAGSRRMADFFPPERWVQNCNGRVYRMAYGMKYPVAWQLVTDDIRNEAVRLSVVDLVQFPTGPEITASQELTAMKRRKDDVETIYRDAAGQLYLTDRGERRYLISKYTCRAWCYSYPEYENALAEHAELPEGLPILPPVRILSEDL